MSGCVVVLDVQCAELKVDGLRIRDSERPHRLIGYSNQTGGSEVDSFVRQLKQVVRRLWRAPMFTCITLVTLAVGIGANSSSFEPHGNNLKDSA